MENHTVILQVEEAVFTRFTSILFFHCGGYPEYTKRVMHAIASQHARIQKIASDMQASAEKGATP